jgi:TolB protein
MSALAPDGRRIVYCDGDPQGSGCHIFICNVDGTGRRQLTFTPKVIDAEPAWSPDGKWVVFVSAQRHRPYSMGGMVWDQWGLWRVNADGDNDERSLSDERFYQAGSLSVSPDGRRVLFWADCPPPANAPAGEPGTDELVMGDLGNDGRIASMRWTPRSPGPQGDLYFAAINRDPAFSPDGSTIVFISNRAEMGRRYEYEVWITDRSFTSARQLTHTHSVLSCPMFTRDGEHILFTDTPAGHETAALYQMKPDGSELRRVQ